MEQKQIGPLVDLGYQLIPLRGKIPLHKQWTTKSYNTDDLAKHKGNLGVRLRGTDLIVDVDPRNFRSADTLTRIMKAGNFNIDDYPTVITGGGGFHVYMSKPENVKVVNELPDFLGVEFKSLGRQVVAPGSKTANLYHWIENEAFEDFDLTGPPPASQELLTLIGRTVAEYEDGDGDIDSTLLAKMLNLLKVEDFRDHSTWVTLMQSCHQATKGSGVDCFVEWCIADPLYADEGDRIRKRWDSLHLGGGVTSRTLFDWVADAGGEALIPRTDASEDFPDDINDPLAEEVLEMNKTLCAVLEGADFTLMRKVSQHLRPGYERDCWIPLKRQALIHFYENQRRSISAKRTISKAELWLTSPLRRDYTGICLDPQNLERNKGKLNLWGGWAIDPVEGDWAMLRSFIYEILCNGRDDAGEYVIRWIAYMLQKPWMLPEVAICFRGEEGVGKGTLGNLLATIAGKHSLHLASSKLLAGNFNAHLRDAIFIFADEALWPGDKSAQGTLNALITEPVISYEAKGKDAVMGANLAHIMMASNEEWLVPAGPTARRFFVTDVSSKYRQNQGYFAKLLKHIYKDGGIQALVYDLMHMDLGNWRPPVNIPTTEALKDQKCQSFSPIVSFWYPLLDSGILPQGGDRWETEAVTLTPEERQALIDDLSSYFNRKGFRYAKSSPRDLLNAGRKYGLKASPWILPPLPLMRTAFEREQDIAGLFA